MTEWNYKYTFHLKKPAKEWLNSHKNISPSFFFFSQWNHKVLHVYYTYTVHGAKLYSYNTFISTCMEWQKNITHNINRCEKAMSLIVLQLVVTLIPVHKHENESIGLSSRYRRYSWPKHSLILLLSKPGDIYQFLSDSHQKAVFYYTEIQY